MTGAHGSSTSQPVRWRHSFETVTGPGTLDELHDCLGTLWSQHPEIPEEVRDAVSVSAFEVCTNVIEYAADGLPVRLHIELLLTSEQIQVRFCDDGHPADVDLGAVAIPTDELAEVGRGLAIAKGFLDELDYRRDNDHNHWLLSRRLSHS